MKSLHLDEDLLAIRRQTEEFVAKEVVPRGEAWERAGSVPRAVMRQMGELGFLGMRHPERYGGLGQDPLFSAVFAEALASSTFGGFEVTVLVHTDMASPHLIHSGSEEQLDRYMPKIISGECLTAIAVTESAAGSDVAGIRTAARRDGDDYVINGSKFFITNGISADLVIVAARTDPNDPRGLSMFLVPGNARGIEVTSFEVMAPHPIGEVRFHDTTLSEAALLGEEGDGLELALATLGRFRTSVAAAACGFARRALDESVRHLSARRQFGKPLSAFQGLRFDLAEMDTRLRAAELLVAEAAQAVDDGSSATAPIARAKLFATEAAFWICDRAVQHLGGLGVKRGEVVERLFREVRALRIYEGTSEVQKLILARELLSPERSDEGEKP